jgi:hypothetical protein
MLLIKRFSALLRFDIAEYFRGGESVLNWLEMVLSRIVDILYMIDIQIYVYWSVNWGIGVWNCA